MNEHLDDTGALLEAGIMQFNQRKIQALEIFTQHSGLRPPDWAVAAGFYPTRASFSGNITSRLRGRRRPQADAQRHLGIIHFCERLLHRPETTDEQLIALPLEELARLADELQAQVIKQR